MKKITLLLMLVSLLSYAEETLLEKEIVFITSVFEEQGFYPKMEAQLAYRGDARSPEEISHAGGFYRKAFSDETKLPSYRPDGCVRHMIGCSKDFDVAIGFTSFPVQVQRIHGTGLNSGWVYAFYIPKGLYFSPEDYENAYLGAWGKELDAIYIPLEYVIGAVHILHPIQESCIHSYLTRVSDVMHRKRGCKSKYIENEKIEIDQLWINDTISDQISLADRMETEETLRNLYFHGYYDLKVESEDSDNASLIMKKFYACMNLCSDFDENFDNLAIRLKPMVKIYTLPRE